MKMARRRLVAVNGATFLIAMIALSDRAGAQFYGYSLQQISNYVISGAAVGPVSSNSLTSAAQLGSPSGSAAQIGTSDALESYVGPPLGKPAENSFTQKGLTTPDYARGDALISTAFTTKGVAEADLVSGANSGASGSWFALFPVTVSTRGSISLSFDFANELDLSHPGASAGNVMADYSFNFTIQDGSGLQVFSSSPTNVNSSASVVVPNGIVFRPSSGSITLSTGTLAVGTYTGMVSGANHVYTFNPNGIIVQAVPEPSGMALVGVGLLIPGAAFFIRRRRA